MAENDRTREMINPPLRRHLSLQPLSRDHYGGLVQSQRLIRSADQDAEQRKQALAGFLAAWQQEISLHFNDEERLLEPLMSAADVKRLQEEHADLRGLAAEAPAQLQEEDPASDFVRRLGQTLHEHIRWEERSLFPAIEQAATRGQLEALVAETAKIEASRPRSQCAM